MANGKSEHNINDGTANEKVSQIIYLSIPDLLDYTIYYSKKVLHHLIFTTILSNVF